MDVINSKVTECHSVKPKVSQAHATSLQRYTNIFIIALWSKTGKKKGRILQLKILLSSGAITIVNELLVLYKNKIALLLWLVDCTL